MANTPAARFQSPAIDGVPADAAGGTLPPAITVPRLDHPPMPAIAPPGVVYNGVPASGFGDLGASRGYPDVRSFRRKFGLVIPATNTSMEHELWSIIFRNQGPQGLQGIGLHTSNVITPSPKLDSVQAVDAYKAQFVGGLKAAIATASLAQPHYMIMGMSLEHILDGIDPIRACIAEVQEYTTLAWATWHDAVAPHCGYTVPHGWASSRRSMRTGIAAPRACSRTSGSTSSRVWGFRARTRCTSRMCPTGRRSAPSWSSSQRIRTRSTRSSSVERT
jgi:hypothetical protein